MGPGFFSDYKILKSVPNQINPELRVFSGLIMSEHGCLACWIYAEYPTFKRKLSFLSANHKRKVNQDKGFFKLCAQLIPLKLKDIDFMQLLDWQAYFLLITSIIWCQEFIMDTMCIDSTDIEKYIF